MIKLGNKAKSLVNGFSGIVTAKTEYLNGCVQYCLKPRVGKDGKDIDGVWFDEQELKVVGKGLVLVGKGKNKGLAVDKSGGAQSDAPRGFGKVRVS